MAWRERTVFDGLAPNDSLSPRVVRLSPEIAAPAVTKRKPALMAPNQDHEAGFFVSGY